MIKKIFFFILLSWVAKPSFSQELSQQDVKNLIEQANGQNLIPELKDNYLVSDAYHDPSVGLTYLYLQQQFQGVRLFNIIKTVVMKQNKIAYQSGSFISNINQKIVGSTIASLTAKQAVQFALQHLSIPISNIKNLEIQQTDLVNNKYTFNTAGVSRHPIQVQLMWVPNTLNNSVELGWNVNIDDVNSDDWWNVRVSATDGRFLSKDNWTVTCHYGPKHDEQVHNSHKHQANTTNYFEEDNLESIHAPAPPPPLNIDTAIYAVCKFPNENPNVGSIVNDTNPWLRVPNSKATTLLWNYNNSINYTITRGNNVYAYDDSLKTNSPGRVDSSVTPLPKLYFNKVRRATDVPTTINNRRAATTNLFYWNNIMHDVAYVYGMDEVGGTFQTSNMGRGGKDKDLVFAEAQDGSGKNNANFATPADGQSPRMQMYLWNSTSTIFDGDFDNGVICHEYGHGISNRLTGGPSQASCLSNAEQGGEGWSDYMALMMTTNWATAKLTDGQLKRPVGTFVIGQTASGAGIRTSPYSTNLSVSKQNYSSLANSNGEVHDMGEVWCAALWDMTWNIIQQEGVINPNIFNPNDVGGNVIAMKLVFQGMKLQPCNPGFIDARNAILAADSILYNNRHKCAIWAAFARRGMGFSASQGSSQSYTDQVTATNLPNGITIKKNNGILKLGPNQVANVTIDASCSCTAPLRNYRVRAFLPSELSYVTGTAGTVSNNVITSDTIGYQRVNQSKSVNFSFSKTGTAGCAIDSIVNDNRDAFTKGGFTSSAITANGVIKNWITDTVKYTSPYNAWHIPSDTNVSNIALTSDTFTVKPFTIMTFNHYYNNENTFDGGVVEYSTNNKQSWNDAQQLFAQNSYNEIMDGSTVIGGRKAFTGNSGSFITSSLNLSSLNGNPLSVRFRYATDSGNSGNDIMDGWFVDDIVVASGCGDFIKYVVYDAANRPMDSLFQPVFYVPQSTVPVQFVRLDAIKSGKSVLLKWVVEQELDMNNYQIEKYMDGQWKPIGTKTADNSRVYSFFDVNPALGSNLYRIKGVGKNGSTYLSEIKLINYSSDVKVSYTVRPNPANDYIIIQQQGEVLPTQATIQLMDVYGKKVLEQKANQTTTTLSTKQLPNGNYYLQVIGADSQLITSQKIIIIH